MRPPELYYGALDAIRQVDGPPHVEVLRVGSGTITVLGRPSMVVQARRALSQAPGRPPNTLEHNLLLHAAFSAERAKGLSLIDARGSAAKKLGAGITAEKVRRATAAFHAELAEWFGPDAADKSEELITETQEILQRLQSVHADPTSRQVDHRRTATG